MEDPCNGSYEVDERVRILGEQYRSDATYSAWRDAEKLRRSAIHMKVAAIFCGVIVLVLIVNIIRMMVA